MNNTEKAIRLKVYAELIKEVENTPLCEGSNSDFDEIDFLQGQAHYKMHVEDLLHKKLSRLELDNS